MKTLQRSTQQSAFSTQPLNIFVSHESYASRRILSFTAEGAEKAEVRRRRKKEEESNAEEKIDKEITSSCVCRYVLKDHEGDQGLSAEC